MKIIISTEPFENIKNNLIKCDDNIKVYNYIMAIPYFCFISVKKDDLYKLTQELILAYSLFGDNVKITSMHNQRFYEEEGINRLNFWKYFRNIEEAKNGIKPDVLKEKDYNRITQAVNKIKTNNFNEKNFIQEKI